MATSIISPTPDIEEVYATLTEAAAVVSACGTARNYPAVKALGRLLDVTRHDMCKLEESGGAGYLREAFALLKGAEELLTDYNDDSVDLQELYAAERLLRWAQEELERLMEKEVAHV